ncbi:hypothetical protein BDP27DRAFT_1528997 [Rhodocollybia butyracea]|uniref:Uncharacterized protein n=1 Tax=Rhodocollybia butyracea TaxID=206335 RepID=A0A9P5PUN8_9AGAR|nr:hypothetical protein BDP27DRAFT_1528997 [Rhodocollybia butyracea]
MAQLIRAAKSAMHWSAHKLLAFNIVIQDVDRVTSFGTPRLPPATTVSRVVLDNVIDPPLPPPVVTYNERLFFTYLYCANDPQGDGDVPDFTSHLFRMLRLDHKEKAITRRRMMTFQMCGSHVVAEADCLLVVKSAKVISCNCRIPPSTAEPVPQVIAQAIAAFVENNRRHQHPSLQQTIPAITMVGPRPIFYKVPVTQDLVSSLMTAQYPSKPTIVQRLVPPVANKEAYMIEGMNTLRDRRVVFQCLKAMRAFLVSYSVSD